LGLFLLRRELLLTAPAGAASGNTPRLEDEQKTAGTIFSFRLFALNHQLSVHITM
jgi:hypothetical protein